MPKYQYKKPNRKIETLDKNRMVKLIKEDGLYHTRDAVLTWVSGADEYYINGNEVLPQDWWTAVYGWLIALAEIHHPEDEYLAVLIGARKSSGLPRPPTPRELMEDAISVEVKRVEDMPYNYVLYSNGDIMVSSRGTVYVQSYWEDLDENQMRLLKQAKKALGVK